MDTIGTIRPSVISPQPASQRAEALERMRYLALQRRCGVLYGSRGSGKTDLLNRLDDELSREAIQVSRINLAGMLPEEIPFQLGGELGLGLPSHTPLIHSWSLIQDFTQACSRSGEHHVLMFDQLDRADQSIAPTLERLLTLVNGTFSCLFASRPKPERAFRSFIKNQSWMEVKLERLSNEDVSQVFAQEISSKSQALNLSSDATSAAKEVTKGRLDKLKRLAELATLAAEAEEIHEINAEIIRALQGEVIVKS
ncbi:AAA family ATPase [Thalassoglobus polymorphus]|uniref:ORC1/DEAH AAA+ ATPase domain-containing protein n=1 Tax=Thalassoglobus polymorphus TaxID=2527994 RepID=A0A517QHU4_9PLAN|nr:AAA family ATPase [Thalassoglobus polymorphus]QDT31200.1 hypothetical protein Mal48_04320 [Thalassoglobus polymorphus]